jgi:predicted metalloprotease
MRWFGREESSNVEDRRGFGGRGIAVGGGGAIILALLAWFLGIDPGQITSTINEGPSHNARRVDPTEDRLAQFTKVVFRDTELVWSDRFQKMGRDYREPTLVLYSGVVDSACGFAQSAVGPFYCPSDSRVYIDLSFYGDMERKLDAPGEFARAYVIAHEVGHHVQRLLGITPRQRSTVPLELQADFLAGIWAHDAQAKFKYLEEGDISSGLNAAFRIGDDRLQKRARGYVVPDSFTHGSSRQRVQAFKRGFESGNLNEWKRVSSVGE